MAKKNGNLDHSDVRHGSESSVNSWRSVSTVRDRPPRSSLSLTANGSGLKSQPKTSRYEPLMFTCSLYILLLMRANRFHSFWNGDELRHPPFLESILRFSAEIR